MGLSEREYLAVHFTQMMDANLVAQEKGPGPKAGEDVEVDAKNMVKVIQCLDTLRRQTCSRMSFDDMMRLINDISGTVLDTAATWRAAKATAEKYGP